MTNVSTRGTYLTISKQQRDLLYERMFRHLAGIDAVWLAASSGAFDDADRLSETYCNELTLIMEDLGWGSNQEGDSPIEISTPPQTVRVVLERLRADAVTLEGEIDAHLDAEENRKLIATCDEILASIRAGCSGPDISSSPGSSSRESDLARRSLLEEVLQSSAARLPCDALVRSVSDQLNMSVHAVRRALEELLDLDLLMSDSDGISASDGLLLVNHLWDDLWQIV